MLFRLKLTNLDQIRGHYFAKLDPLSINVLNLDKEGAWLKNYNFGLCFMLTSTLNFVITRALLCF